MTNFTHDTKLILKRGKWIESKIKGVDWNSMKDYRIVPKYNHPAKEDHLGYALFIMILCCLLALWLVSHRTDRKTDNQETHEVKTSQLAPAVFTYEDLADAIFHAEGGRKATYLYGIRSVHYESEKEARAICLRTIKNNIRRYREYGHRDFTTYLSFLGSRYCPTKGEGRTDAEKRLNPNWRKNVEYFLNNPKEV